MAVCGSCDARDGERIRSRELSRTGLARVRGDLRLSGGWVGRRRCRQAGSGMARSRAKARLNFSAQGQRFGRCGVNRRAERVSRPAREKNRRLRVLVVTICSPRPMRAVQRAMLWAIVWTASQAPLAAKRPKLELNPPADAVVRRVFDMVLQGKSILDVTKTLNTEGIPTTNGKKWLKTTIHTMLSHEAYTGTVVWGANAKDGAPPAIVSKRDFQKARRLLGSRAPKKVNPRRASSPYLLSGIAKCETCGKAMTAAEAKSGKYTYYICHSLLKRGKGACETPRLNAKKFEKIIVDEIRANILTESNIRDLVKLLDEEMDGVAREQRERLESIDGELEEVKNQLGRVWHFIARSDSVDVAEASDLIVELRERKEKLEIATEEARALLKERRQFLDSADTIAAFAAEMSDFLKTSELTETKAFVGSFVKEVVVKPGRAAIVYSIPTPEDSPIGGADAAEIALNGRVMNSVRHGGPILTVDRTIFEMWLGALSGPPRPSPAIVVG